MPATIKRLFATLMTTHNMVLENMMTSSIVLKTPLWPMADGERGREKNTKMKNPLHWICSRSATTTRRKGTQISYNLPLLKWKRMSLNLLKMDNLSLQLRLYLTCSLSTPRSLGFFSMSGSSMCVREPVVPTLKRNWQRRRKRMQSFGRLSTP